MNAKNTRSGQSLVEFAMVAPLFFFLIMGIFDLGNLFFTEMTLQNALRQAGRFAVTGNHLQDPSNPSQTLSRVNSIKQIAKKASMGIPITNIQISSLSGGSGSAPPPGDTVTVTLTYNFRPLTPFVAQFFKNGLYTFKVGTSFRNEPFPPSQAN